jgi:Secretion system C-terminal sorting domain
MVDLDGKFVYSKTVSVSADKNNVPLVIYNNPFTDLIRIKVNVSRAQNLNMTVSDMLGKTYVRKSIQAQAGDNLVNLQPAVIGGSGMYILRITGDSYNQTAKIEKQ